MVELSAAKQLRLTTADIDQDSKKINRVGTWLLRGLNDNLQFTSKIDLIPVLLGQA